MMTVSIASLMIPDSVNHLLNACDRSRKRSYSHNASSHDQGMPIAIGSMIHTSSQLLGGQ